MHNLLFFSFYFCECVSKILPHEPPDERFINKKGFFPAPDAGAGTSKIFQAGERRIPSAQCRRSYARIVSAQCLISAGRV